MKSYLIPLALREAVGNGLVYQTDLQTGVFAYARALLLRNEYELDVNHGLTGFPNPQCQAAIFSLLSNVSRELPVDVSPILNVLHNVDWTCVEHDNLHRAFESFASVVSDDHLLIDLTDDEALSCIRLFAAIHSLIEIFLPVLNSGTGGSELVGCTECVNSYDTSRPTSVATLLAFATREGALDPAYQPSDNQKLWETTVPTSNRRSRSVMLIWKAYTEVEAYDAYAKLEKQGFTVDLIRPIGTIVARKTMNGDVANASRWGAKRFPALEFMGAQTRFTKIASPIAR